MYFVRVLKTDLRECRIVQKRVIVSLDHQLKECPVFLSLSFSHFCLGEVAGGALPTRTVFSLLCLPTPAFIYFCPRFDSCPRTVRIRKEGHSIRISRKETTDSEEITAS